jgi:hypothetical protein
MGDARADRGAPVLAGPIVADETWIVTSVPIVVLGSAQFGDVEWRR